MSEGLAGIAARKQLLIARSRLHRLQIQHELQSLRRSLVRPMTVLSIAASPPVRPLLFSALMFVLGRGRLSRLLRRAMTAMTIVKIVRAASGMFGGPQRRPPARDGRERA
jgi:hypothetical protein